MNHKVTIKTKSGEQVAVKVFPGYANLREVTDWREDIVDGYPEEYPVTIEEFVVENTNSENKEDRIPRLDRWACKIIDEAHRREML